MLNRFKILSFAILMLTSSSNCLYANTFTTQIQIMLNTLDFNAGPEDGIFGEKTKTALETVSYTHLTLPTKRIV